MLDMIRAEIEQLPTNTRVNEDICRIEYVDISKNNLLKIIDKYKESEDEE